MRNVLEYDFSSSLITNLGFDQENMYKEADSLVNLELAEQLKRSSISYYRELMENKDQVSVRYSGFSEANGVRRGGKSDELFVLFDTIELIYPVERFTFSEVPDAKEIGVEQKDLEVKEKEKEELVPVQKEEKQVPLAEKNSQESLLKNSSKTLRKQEGNTNMKKKSVREDLKEIKEELAKENKTSSKSKNLSKNTKQSPNKTKKEKSR